MTNADSLVGIRVARPLQSALPPAPRSSPSELGEGSATKARVESHTVEKADSASGGAATTSGDAVVIKLQALEEMDSAALRSEWRRLYRANPPQRVARDLLMLGIAWKIQAQAFGGLGAVTKRGLAELANTLEQKGDVRRNRVARLKPGAKLLREWHGETHTVIVREDGFVWKDRTWLSLSAIAREITGVHWSGPRFFGLAAKALERSGNDHA